MDKIAIIGTGLIGTSLGMSIKNMGMKNVEIVGTDLEKRNVSRALKMGAIDRQVASMIKASEGAELVIISTPVTAMEDIMKTISPCLKENCRLVTDTGNTKGVVAKWADKYLPSHVSFVGGHPIIKTSIGRGIVGGPDNASKEIFKGQLYILTPSKNAKPDAIQFLTDMIRSFGAMPYFMDIEEHDSFSAAVNYLPVVISMAIVSCTSKSPSWTDISKLASTYYRNITSLATTINETKGDLLNNIDSEIVYWIDTFMQEIMRIRNLISDSSEDSTDTLRELFSNAVYSRSVWQEGLSNPGNLMNQGNQPKVPSVMEGMAQFFVGDSGARRRIIGQIKKNKKGQEF